MTYLQKQLDNSIHRVDFDKLELCTFTDPIECNIGKRVLKGNGWNWRDLLVAICEYFIEIKKVDIRKFTLRSGKPFFMKDKPANGDYRQLSNRYYIAVKHNTQTLVRIIGRLCKYCGIDLLDVNISYAPKDMAILDLPIPEQEKSTLPIMKLPIQGEFADIIDFEYGKNGLRNILNSHFQALYGYSNSYILWDAAQNALPMFLNDNAINSANDLWQFTYRVLGNENVFNSPHIWKIVPNYPQNACGLIINLAQQTDGIVTREQIDVFFSRIKITSPSNSALLAQGEILSYDVQKYIVSETVNLNAKRCKALSKTLSTFFLNENVAYTVLRDISHEWFSQLPELPNGICWTPLLLQEVLRIHPNIGYRTVVSQTSGHGLNPLNAVIVPDNSEIATFADIVHRFCYNKYKLPYKLPSEELRQELRNVGMLEGKELMRVMHKALKDYRFAFTEENKMVKILER
jgi:hypothetical protein